MSDTVLVALIATLSAIVEVLRQAFQVSGLKIDVGKSKRSLSTFGTSGGIKKNCTARHFKSLERAWRTTGIHMT
jgi:hypothetical protein